MFVVFERTYSRCHFISLQMHSIIKTSRKDHKRKTMAHIQVHLLNSNRNRAAAPVAIPINQAIHMHRNGHHSSSK